MQVESDSLASMAMAYGVKIPSPFANLKIDDNFLLDQSSNRYIYK